MSTAGLDPLDTSGDATEFAPDQLLPLQFAELLRRPSGRTPEQRLTAGETRMLNGHATVLPSEAVHPRQCGARPILLLHGFLSTPLVLTMLTARLRRSGYCAHRVDLGGLFGRYNSRPVEEIARLVADRVAGLVADHGGRRLALVGHSEGGIIGRYYVERLSGSRRVSHLITLGTPHRGTPWAYSGYLLGHLLPSLPQMAPGSALLRALVDDAFPPNVRLTSVYSRQDAVCPPSSCRLATHHGPHLKNVEVARGGHLRFLFSATVASIICGELESAQPAVVAERRLGYAMSPPRPTAATVGARTPSARAA